LSSFREIPCSSVVKPFSRPRKGRGTYRRKHARSRKARHEQHRATESKTGTPKRRHVPVEIRSRRCAPKQGLGRLTRDCPRPLTLPLGQAHASNTRRQGQWAIAALVIFVQGRHLGAGPSRGTYRRKPTRSRKARDEQPRATESKTGTPKRRHVPVEIRSRRCVPKQGLGRLTLDCPRPLTLPLGQAHASNTRRQGQWAIAALGDLRSGTSPGRGSVPRGRTAARTLHRGKSS